MKRIGFLAMFFILAVLLPMGLMGQEKPPAPPQKVTPLRVEVVIAEYDGAKKLSSLPYSFHVNADDPSSGGARTTSSIRAGLRVPINTGPAVAASTTVSSQFQYMDIGTNVDCRAESVPENRFRLVLSVDRSYFYSTPQGEKKPEATAAEGFSISSGNPIIGHFNSSYDLYIRDGQTIEATSTTDPISGRVLKINVTVNVVK